ncbi:hypothetical protein HMPREF9469_00899 [ [[Clostridium] citroniae WAL-17108]|uniref:Uncharacterized protein n=1 Tax=[Clostridium] citroniae WAL-17108 TaxID=742733 RepID=G5HEM6_9FIRM|nr:hypothetical protein HMPREF9469_00899 [ [[Clostridium] citroniae WAL-17108]MCC3383248.1 hypothetical protein [Enterocloster citroniae]
MDYIKYIRNLSDEYLLKAFSECRVYHITKILPEDGHVKEICRKYNEIYKKDVSLELLINDIYFELALRYYNSKLWDLQNNKD